MHRNGIRFVVALLLGMAILGATLGCASMDEARDSEQPDVFQGAEGDREVSDGPGLFSGEKGGLEYKR